jgi:RNA polymerase sigma factor (sigma-70 family)
MTQEKAKSMPGSGAGEITTDRVRRALEGDHRSLGWLVTRLSPLLRVQASHRMGPRLRRHLDPEDVVAEAWLVACRRLRDLERRDGRLTPRLLAFLSETIVRTINDHLKRCIRRGEMGPPASMEALEADPMDHFRADITGVVTQAVRDECQNVIGDALSRLGEEERLVVVLRGVEGLTNAEAARELDELPTTVSHRYRRALAKLRNALPESIFVELVED